MIKLYGGPGRDETAVNLSSFQNLKSSLYRSRLQRFPTLPQILTKWELTKWEDTPARSSKKKTAATSSTKPTHAESDSMYAV